MKHTPGPWNVVNARPTDALDICIIFDADSQVVCSVPKGSSNKPQQERRANARMLAAAPDLLAALRTARKELRLCNLTEDGEQKTNTAVARALEAVDAAIAKATE